jgi:hypothetical protein
MDSDLTTNLIWQYSKNVTIESGQVHVDLVNFPVLLTLYDQDLHDHVEQSNGNDIAFYAGETKLDHEIEFFSRDYNNSHARLTVWIRIPELSSTIDTIISMYYGNATIGPQENPSGVWGSQYRGVWHLNESVGGSMAMSDSSGNSNHGTDIDSPQLDQSGQIEQSVEFSTGTNQSIEILNNPGLLNVNTFTVQAWVYADSFTMWHTLLSKSGGPMDSRSVMYYDFYMSVSSFGEIFVGLSSPSTFDEWYTGVVMAPAEWYQMTFTYNSSTSMGILYLNGTQVASHNFTLGTLIANTKPFSIGWNRVWIEEIWNGRIDEVRILNSILSPEFIEMEYVNQLNPDSLFNIGPELSLPQYNRVLMIGEFMFPSIIYHNQKYLLNLTLTDPDGWSTIHNCSLSLESDLSFYWESATPDLWREIADPNNYGSLNESLCAKTILNATSIRLSFAITISENYTKDSIDLITVKAFDTQNQESLTTLTDSYAVTPQPIQPPPENPLLILLLIAIVGISIATTSSLFVARRMRNRDETSDTPTSTDPNITTTPDEISPPPPLETPLEFQPETLKTTDPSATFIPQNEQFLDDLESTRAKLPAYSVSSLTALNSYLDNLTVSWTENLGQMETDPSEITTLVDGRGKKWVMLNLLEQLFGLKKEVEEELAKKTSNLNSSREKPPNE